MNAHSSTRSLLDLLYSWCVLSLLPSLRTTPPLIYFFTVGYNIPIAILNSGVLFMLLFV